MEEFHIVCQGLIPQKGKVRILTNSDHPMLHTGFANVHRHILAELSKMEDVQIASVGWYAPRERASASNAGEDDGLFADNTTPWYVVPCEPHQGDWCGTVSLPRAMKAMRPEIVISIGDPWMVKVVSEMRKMFDFIWIAYVPIDGLGLIQPHREVLEEADHVIAYSTFGKQVLQQALPRKDVKIINHGTDPELYTPDTMPKEELRRLMGISNKKNEFIVGWIARNTQRKRADLAVTAFAMFCAPSITTKDNLLYFKGFDREYDRINKDDVVVQCGEKEDAKMYMHYPKDEQNGFDIGGIAIDLGIDRKLTFTDGVRVGEGVSHEKLRRLYSILDVSLNTSESEGWGMPLHESMAAGLPVIAPMFGGYLGDLLEHLKTGFLAGVSNLNREVSSNCVRCLVDVKSVVMYLDLLYYYRIGEEGMKTFFAKWCQVEGDPIYDAYQNDSHFVDTIIEAGKKRAHELNWTAIGEQWRELVMKSSPTLQKKRAVEIVQGKADRPHIVALADVIDPTDPKAYGPERSFYEVLKMMTKNHHVLGLGYSRDRRANINYRINEEGKFTMMDIVYGMGGANDFTTALSPNAKAILTHGFPSQEACAISRANNIPMVMFLYNYQHLCGNGLRMGTCPVNCWSCGDFVNDSHQVRYNTYIRAMNLASKLVFPSHYAKKMIGDHWGKEVVDFEKKSIVCYPMVDFTDPRVFVDNFDRAKKKKITIFGGNEQKGSLLALVAAKLLPDYDFLFIEAEDIITKEVADRFGNVYFGSKTATPASIYAQASLVLIPSITPENFSRVAIEALGNNIPVLASMQGGMKEVLDRKFLVEKYLDPQAWAHEISVAMSMIEGKKYDGLIKNTVALYRQNVARQQTELFNLVTKVCS